MKFILNRDTLTIEKEEEINSGSVNYYEADVEYDSSWNGLIIEARLIGRDEEEGKQIAVIGNKVFIDKKEFGWHSIGFIGYKIENEVKTYQISTDLQAFCIQRGAGGIDVVESENPTPTEWELYIAQIEKIANGVSDEITNKVLEDIQPTLDKNLQDMKDYTDKEIATFDFIKIVPELPEVGLTNRMYFVPKANPETQDLFDEYIWINKGTEEEPSWDWEFMGTKKIEIDLTHYIKDTDYATSEKPGLVSARPEYGLAMASNGHSIVPSVCDTQGAYTKQSAWSFISKGTLENLLGWRFVTLTQAEYDALVESGTINENTYYFIKEE